MNRNEALLAIYNRRVKRAGAMYAVYEEGLGNVPINSHIAFFKAEEWIKSDLTLTKSGKERVMAIMNERMQ